MPEPITRSFSLMRLTKPSSPIRRFPTPSTRLTGHGSVRFRSFSKNAGFTGTRCAFTVVPKNCLRSRPMERKWKCGSYGTASTKFNGVSYIVQRSRGSTPSPDRRKSRRSSASMENAKIIRETDSSRIGGVWGRAPYVWVKTQ